MPDFEPKQIEVPAGQVHCFVYRPAWIIEVEKEPDGRRIDEVQLQCERGGYRESVRREAAHDGGPYWRFGFPRGPAGTYRVDIVSGGERYCVWKGLSLPAEHEDSPPLEPPPTERPPAAVIHIDGCARESAT